MKIKQRRNVKSKSRKMRRMRRLKSRSMLVRKETSTRHVTVVSLHEEPAKREMMRVPKSLKPLKRKSHVVGGSLATSDKVLRMPGVRSRTGHSQTDSLFILDRARQEGDAKDDDDAPPRQQCAANDVVVDAGHNFCQETTSHDQSIESYCRT